MAEDITSKIINQGFSVASGKPQQDAMQSTAALGQTIANIAQQREQLDMAKQQMEQAKLTKFVDALDKGKTFKGAARGNYYKKFMPRMRDSLGLTEHFPDEALEFMTADEENLNRLNHVKAAVMEGTLTIPQALGIINDPTKFAEFSGQAASPWQAPTEEEMADFMKAAQFGKAQRTELAKNINTIVGSKERQATDIATAGQVEVAKKAGADYVAWQSDKSGVNAQIAKLESAIDTLKSRKVVTGTKALAAASIWDATQDLAFPEVASVRDEIRGAVQETLRATMGAQFTEREGTALFNRAFNPRLSNEENVKRARAVLTDLKERIKNKEKLFERQGFAPVSGENTTPSPAINQGYVDVIRNALASGRTEADIKASLKRKGKTDSEIKALMNTARGK